MLYDGAVDDWHAHWPELKQVFHLMVHSEGDNTDSKTFSVSVCIHRCENNCSNFNKSQIYQVQHFMFQFGQRDGAVPLVVKKLHKQGTHGQK